jgi:hypothetical protein
VKKDSLKCPRVATLDQASSRIEKINNSHLHTPNLLKEAARAEEKKLIMAAATESSCLRSEVINREKTNILQSALPEAWAKFRKAHDLGQAIQHKRRKILSTSGAVPENPGGIMKKLLDRFKTTCGGTLS